MFVLTSVLPAPPPPVFTHTPIIMPLRVIRPTCVLTSTYHYQAEIHMVPKTLHFVSHRPRDDHPVLIDAALRRQWLQMNREEESQNVMADDVNLCLKMLTSLAHFLPAHPVALMVCLRACTVLSCFPRSSLMTQPPVSWLSILSDHYSHRPV